MPLSDIVWGNDSCSTEVISVSLNGQHLPINSPWTHCLVTVVTVIDLSQVLKTGEPKVPLCNNPKCTNWEELRGTTDSALVIFNWLGVESRGVCSRFGGRRERCGESDW